MTTPGQVQSCSKIRLWVEIARQAPGCLRRGFSTEYSPKYGYDVMKFGVVREYLPVSVIGVQIVMGV